MAKVALFSSVRQRPDILKLFLQQVDKVPGIVDCRFFYDDNDDKESSRLTAGRVCLRHYELPSSCYEGHNWDPALYARISVIKNNAFTFFLHQLVPHGFTHLMMLDSDVLIAPGLVERLVSYDLPIVAEIFWSQWREGDVWMPNCWYSHPYGFLSHQQIAKLAQPGLYRMHGLGACTLIRSDVLETVDFSPIPGIFAWGEDRHFCLRAAVAGFQMFVDTCYPAFHVYRPGMLEEARSWIEAGCPPEYFRENWLTAEWEKRLAERTTKVTYA